MFSDEEQEKIVKIINALSPVAFHIVGFKGFGMRYSYHYGKNDTALLVPANEEQEIAFQELMKVGFVVLDTERGQVGYRSNDRGLIAYHIVDNHNKKKKKKE
jgi:hypothetical protein